MDDWRDIMSRIGTNMSGYLHTYEAYVVPKGTKVMDNTGREIVLSEDEDVPVLTQEAGRQLVKDRKAYNTMLLYKAEMAAQRTQKASSEKMAQDQAKIMAVYRTIARGDSVPSSDEKKLIEYSPELYQAAKTAQALVQQEKRKKQASQWDEQEEKAHKEKMEKLRAESDEAVSNLVSGSGEFSAAQKKCIVISETPEIDFSSVKVINLGSGVMGTGIDLSI